MNDLSCGDLEGLTEDQRDNVYPYEKPQREDDPLNYRCKLVNLTLTLALTDRPDRIHCMSISISSMIHMFCSAFLLSLLLSSS